MLSRIYGESRQEKQASEPLLSADQLLATNYFRFLEANGFLKCDKEYFYGDLLQSTPSDIEEPMLILLQMLKIFFPGGHSLQVPQSHLQFLSGRQHSNAQATLLTRVLCLFPLQMGKGAESATVDPQHIDYDLAAFCSYA